jgi:two-component system CheB/CheR fusion protein
MQFWRSSVPHLSPNHESGLVALLSSQSSLPVVQAVDGMVVERNHVYVIAPGTQLSVVGARLAIAPRPGDRSQPTPVDALFSSLARTAGNRAIAVVLSGTASDGALGVREVKAAGGLTIAQAPSSAKYDGMPRAAIATGMVDLVLPPDAIGAKLWQLSSHTYAHVPETRTTDLLVTEAQLQDIFRLLRPASGVDFREYKLPAIKRRVLRRMGLHRLTDVDDYVKLLRRNSGEVASLYQDLLSHVTRFFREPASFGALRTKYLRACSRGARRMCPCVRGCPAAPPARKRMRSRSRSPNSCRSIALIAACRFLPRTLARRWPQSARHSPAASCPFRSRSGCASRETCTTISVST